MRLFDLPRHSDQIDAAIAQAAHAGASGIAQLAVLCLWKAGQRIDPKSVYTGPEGVRPLDYLPSILNQFKTNRDPGFITSSTFTQIFYDFPQPKYNGPPQDVSDSAAREEVNAIIRQAEPEPSLRRDYLIATGLRDLANRGFRTDLLRPLIHRVIDQVSTPPYYFGAAERLRALVAAHEFEAAARMVETIPITVRSGVFDRLLLARLLAQQARYNEARERLRDLYRQRSNWLRDDPDRHMVPEATFDKQCAEIYTYMGDHTAARNMVVGVDNPEFWLKIECVRLIRQKYDGQAPDVKSILAIMPKVARLTTEKHSAATQTGVLRMLLELSLESEALSILPLLFDTLHRVPLWGKYEFRLHDAALALISIAEKYEIVIFPFVRDLLIASAQAQPNEKADSGFWRVTHSVCAIGSLIKVWASEADYQQLIDFVDTWNQ